MRAWWRALPTGARWAVVAGVALLALALAAQLWGALVVALGAFVGALTGRTPAHPGAQATAARARDAAHRAVGAAEARAESIAVVVEGAPARDAATDRVMAEAAAEVPQVAGEAPFLAELRKRGGGL
jgi:hypothetical protein